MKIVINYNRTNLNLGELRISAVLLRILIIFLIFSFGIGTSFGDVNKNTVKDPVQPSQNKLLHFVYKSISKDSRIKNLYLDMEFIFNQSPDFCPNLNIDFFDKFSNVSKQCFSVSYKNTSYMSYAVLLKTQATEGEKGRKLIIYNHGHSGIPSDQEKYANEFIKNRLDLGFDVLVVSMPFRGLNEVASKVSIKTWDGWATWDPSWLQNSNPHVIFEAIDTGSSHFMRFFIDDSIVPAIMLRENYRYIAYVGLSGGATTGLYTCSALQNLIQDCFLIAGVMPYKYRLTPMSFGDTEQISASFYKYYQVIPLLKEIKRQNVYLIYNDSDPCCFDSASATLFSAELKSANLENIHISIRESNQHDFDPQFLQSIIDSHSK